MKLAEARPKESEVCGIDWGAAEYVGGPVVIQVDTRMAHAF